MKSNPGNKYYNFCNYKNIYILFVHSNFKQTRKRGLKCENDDKDFTKYRLVTLKFTTYYNFKKYFWRYLTKKYFLIFKNSFIYFKNFNYIEFQDFCYSWRIKFKIIDLKM